MPAKPVIYGVGAQHRLVMTVQKQLEILADMNANMIVIVTQLSEKVQELEDRINGTVDLLKKTAIKGALQDLMIGAAIAEIAQGDRERLDSFMARTVGRAEMMRLGNDDAPIVLEALDGLMTIAESFAAEA